MSLPNFPNITPTISLGRGDVVNLLLASIAIEELSLAHILNAEGEKFNWPWARLANCLRHRHWKKF